MVLSAIGKPKCSARKFVRIKWLARSRRDKGRELYVRFHLRVSVNEQGAVASNPLCDSLLEVIRENRTRQRFQVHNRNPAAKAGGE